MTSLEKDRLEAALELCGCVQGLIATDMVPDYMVEFLESRVARMLRLYGMNPRLKIFDQKKLNGVS